MTKKTQACLRHRAKAPAAVRIPANRLFVSQSMLELCLEALWSVLLIRVIGRCTVSNGMDAPTRTGTNVPKWKCHQPLEPKGASIRDDSRFRGRLEG